MLLNVDQLQKQLDKDEFQEDGSMTAFCLENKPVPRSYIDFKVTWINDSPNDNTTFVEYTESEVKHFRDTLLQHMGNVKKFVAKRTRHQRQYDRRVNKRQMQTQESKQVRNETYAEIADIRPIYDDEPMAEKTSPRSDLRWKPTGRIFKSVGLRWIPTGKLFDSCTKQEVHQAAETVTTSNELDVLFGPLFEEYFNRENQVVLKSSAVTTTDASNKRQQPDSTSSTSTLATTVTANGNFDL
ncbi:hypothetical protein Tco_1252161 [Tanacetum coccineum]